LKSKLRLGPNARFALESDKTHVVMNADWHFTNEFIIKSCELSLLSSSQR
jgi:hypothetical protein